MIKFRCHHCNKKIGVEDSHRGRRVWCPRCRVLTTVPQPTPYEDDPRADNDKTIYSVYICRSEPDHAEEKTLDNMVDLLSD